MKFNYSTLIILITVFCFNSISYSQEEISQTTENQTTENSLLYSPNWKLDKMSPKFSSDIELTLSFDKTTEQLKVVKILKSDPVLKGTNLVTTKNKSVEFYPWSYAVKDTEYEGDNIKSTSYNYEIIELKTEGYIFNIDYIDDTSLVLKVVKAPKVIFGNSVFNTEKIYFIK